MEEDLRLQCPLVNLPEVEGLCLEEVVAEAQQICVKVATSVAQALGHVCGVASPRFQSRYQRTVTDLPWAGVTVRLLLHVRLFRILQTHYFYEYRQSEYQGDHRKLLSSMWLLGLGPYREISNGGGFEKRVVWSGPVSLHEGVSLTGWWAFFTLAYQDWDGWHPFYAPIMTCCPSHDRQQKQRTTQRCPLRTVTAQIMLTVCLRGSHCLKMKFSKRAQTPHVIKRP